MYRIGDFSVISRVSIKMLRHYDDMELLKPREVDRFTGYRYYTLDQLPRLNRIMALKSMGFSLAEIRDLLEGSLPAEVLKRQAAAKRKELLAQLQETEQKLAHLQTWMRRIELESAMPQYEIILKSMTEHLPPLPEPSPEMITLPLPNRAGLPQDVMIANNDPIPPDMLACTVHTGAEDDLIQAYLALDLWIKENSYQPAGPPREITLQQSPLIIEVQLPIKTRG
jgi:DNA-binding transcriptional MerR regulator